MSPIFSKPQRPPPKTPKEATQEALRKAKPILQGFLDLLKNTIEDCNFVLNSAAERIDKLVPCFVRVLEDFCCMDYKRFARGPEPKLPSYLPVLFVLMLMMMLYNAFVFVYMPAAGIPLSSPTSLIFHAFIFLVFASFIQCIRTDPGGIPSGAAWRTKGSPPPNLNERKNTSNGLRWCRKSNAYKPDRAHYCHILRRPVLRMDHHCPWLSSTIGFANHKFFYLFLLYTLSACGLLGWDVMQLLVQSTLPALSTFVLIGAEALSFLLTTILGPFFLFHTWLLLRNMTTIEFCGAMRIMSKDEDFPKSPYDLGFASNVNSVLGTNPLLWCIPVGQPEGFGLSFATRPPSSAHLIPAAVSATSSCQADESERVASGDTADEKEEDPEAAHPAVNRCQLEDDPSDSRAASDSVFEAPASEEEYTGKQGEGQGHGGSSVCMDSVADFLTWQSAAEFADDLRVGCEVLGCEVTEDSWESAIERILQSTSWCLGFTGKTQRKRKGWQRNNDQRRNSQCPSRPVARHGFVSAPVASDSSPGAEIP